MNVKKFIGFLNDHNLLGIGLSLVMGFAFKDLLDNITYKGLLPLIKGSLAYFLDLKSTEKLELRIKDEKISIGLILFSFINVGLISYIVYNIVNRFNIKMKSL